MILAEHSTELPIARLRALGASSAQVARMRVEWRAMEPIEREAAAAELAEMTDAELLSAIASERHGG